MPINGKAHAHTTMDMMNHAERRPFMYPVQITIRAMDIIAKPAMPRLCTAWPAFWFDVYRPDNAFSHCEGTRATNAMVNRTLETKSTSRRIRRVAHIVFPERHCSESERRVPHVFAQRKMGNLEVEFG